jgi:cytochrome b6-f complex iron-sulfur subunit
MALFAAETVGLIIYFAIPRFREGEFGGAFVEALDSLPEKNAEPVNRAEGRYWLVNLDTTVDQGSERMYLASDETEPIVGVAAIYKVCTHLGCIYAWNTANQRFECPCHGSKYRLDGRRIESPAPRSLDRFLVEILDADGVVLASSPVDADGAYGEVALPAGAQTIRIDTGARLDGATKTLICDLRGTCP